VKIQKNSKTIIFLIPIFALLILPFSVSNSFAEEEIANYDFRVVSGDEIMNNPLAVQILKNIEIAKQRLAEQQERQRQIQEHQIFVEKQRQIAKQLLQEDLDRMFKKYEPYTPRNSYTTFLTKIDPTVHDIYWGQFDYQQQKVEAGRAAMQAVLANGGSMQEARQAYFDAAATTRAQIIQVNEDLNIKFGYAVQNIQDNFDANGKLPRFENDDDAPCYGCEEQNESTESSSNG